MITFGDKRQAARTIIINLLRKQRRQEPAQKPHGSRLLHLVPQHCSGEDQGCSAQSLERWLAAGVCRQSRNGVPNEAIQVPMQNRCMRD